MPLVPRGFENHLTVVIPRAVRITVLVPRIAAPISIILAMIGVIICPLGTVVVSMTRRNDAP